MFKQRVKLLSFFGVGLSRVGESFISELQVWPWSSGRHRRLIRSNTRRAAGGWSDTLFFRRDRSHLISRGREVSIFSFVPHGFSIEGFCGINMLCSRWERRAPSCCQRCFKRRISQRERESDIPKMPRRLYSAFFSAIL